MAERRRLPGPACLLERQGQAVLRKPEVLVLAPQGLLDELEVLAKEGDRLGVLAELGQRPPEVPEAEGAVGMPAAEVFGQDGEAPARELLRLVGSPAAIEHHAEPREGLGELEAVLAIAPAEDLHRLPVERLRAGIVPPACQELGEADPQQAPGPLPSDAAPPELDRRVKESLGLVARLPHAEDGGEMLERDRPPGPAASGPSGSIVRAARAIGSAASGRSVSMSSVDRVFMRPASSDPGGIPGSSRAARAGGSASSNRPAPISATARTCRSAFWSGCAPRPPCSRSASARRRRTPLPRRRRRTRARRPPGSGRRHRQAARRVTRGRCPIKAMFGTA